MKVHTRTHIYGIRSTGKKDLTNHLDGERLTKGQAIVAKCYDCVCGYIDGKRSCGVPECPLFPFMPYRENVKCG